MVRFGDYGLGMAKQLTITFDAHRPLDQATFWAALLGYRLPDPPPGFDSWDAWADHQNIPAEERDAIAAIEDPDGVGPRLLFLKVPEDKTVKNRVHLDVHSRSERTGGMAEQQAAVAAEVTRVAALGATEGQSFEEFGAFWTVMTDPEGNEFCIV